MVEPVDVLQRGEFDVVEAAPGAAASDEFGLVEADEGLGGGVEAPIAVKRHEGGSTRRS